MPICFIQTSQDTCCQRESRCIIGFTCCSHAYAHRFSSSELDFASTIISSLSKPHPPQYHPQDAVSRNWRKEASFLSVRPIPSYQRNTVTWLQFQHVLSCIPAMCTSQSVPLSGHSATLCFYDSTSEGCRQPERLLCDSYTMCPTHRELPRARMRYISVPWSNLGSWLRQTTQL